MQAHHDILAALAAPFDPRLVSWRVGHTNQDGTQAQALAYVDKYVVMQRFDDVLGTDWCNEFDVNPNGSVTCRIGIFLDGRWIYRADGTAAPKSSSDNSDKADQARKMQEKGTYSDAFKRAARKWGVGRYIETTMPQPWVPVEPSGRSHRFTREAWHQLWQVTQENTARVTAALNSRYKANIPALGASAKIEQIPSQPPANETKSAPASTQTEPSRVQIYKEMHAKLSAAPHHEAIDALLEEYRDTIRAMSVEMHGRWLSVVAAKREELMRSRAA